jgi:hypothetical protein
MFEKMLPKENVESEAKNIPVETIDINGKSVPKVTVTIQGYWDTVSRNEMVLSAIRKLPFYRQGLLYSGFNAASIKDDELVFCGKEDDLLKDEVEDNPINYALEDKDDAKTMPAIAVYDETKMNIKLGDYRAYITTKGALLAVIILEE